jgi:protein-S-isoprenylcysteine O-methyltransferase Ste14
MRQNHTFDYRRALSLGPASHVHGAVRFFVGLALISASWLIVIPVVAAILVLYARLGKEETMMTEQFGAEYRAYMQRTGRLLPRG